MNTDFKCRYKRGLVIRVEKISNTITLLNRDQFLQHAPLIKALSLPFKDKCYLKNLSTTALINIIRSQVHITHIYKKSARARGGYVKYISRENLSSQQFISIYKATRAALLTNIFAIPNIFLGLIVIIIIQVNVKYLTTKCFLIPLMLYKKIRRLFTSQASRARVYYPVVHKQTDSTHTYQLKTALSSPSLIPIPSKKKNNNYTVSISITYILDIVNREFNLMELTYIPA